jgi:SAM-dependent methyltransferase
MSDKKSWLFRLKVAAAIFIGAYRTLYGLLHRVPGLRFHIRGQHYALRSLFKRDLDKFLRFWLNPVVMMRFPEFDYTWHATEWKRKKILDVSSPRMFAAYLCTKIDDADIRMLNPDKADLQETAACFSTFAIPADRFSLVHSFSDVEEEFDIVYAISVIEHVSELEEKVFLKRIWDRLKPNGIFILTFPAAARFRIEYRQNNPYGLEVPQNEKGEYFYQRVYDEEAVYTHIIEPWKNFGGTCSSLQTYGLKAGWSFAAYRERWQRSGLRETQKDIVYAATYLKPYENTGELPDRGICGLSLFKGGGGSLTKESIKA